MSLSRRLSMLTAAGIVIVLTAYGYTRVIRELALFEEDVRRDHSILAQTLAFASISVGHRVDPGAAVQLIEDANLDQAHIAIGWVPARLADVLDDASTGPPRSEITDDPKNDERLLRTRIPVKLGAGWEGFIELRELMTAEHEYVRTTIIRAAISIILTIIICVFIIVVISHVIVGRPLKKIMGTVRRIAQGDLSGRLYIRQKGEIGELACEINNMSGQLSEALQRIEQEAMAKIAVMEQLRHADRLTTVGTLASGIAHELGTPLNIITARALMIEREESTGDEVIEDARSIRNQADRITAIIRQLLDFARRKQPTKHRQDLSALVMQSIALLRPLARKRDVQLECSVTNEPIIVSVDAAQIEQVLTNLVMNAIQAQPQGGIVRVIVEPRSDDDERRVTIVVEDDGPGIPEEVKAHIFEPFFTTKDVGEGTGLGLSVVYGIVKEHDGSIEVLSTPGKGSTFRVTFTVVS